MKNRTIAWSQLSAVLLLALAGRPGAGGVFLLWGLFLAAAHAERIGSRLSDSCGQPRPSHRRRPSAGGVDGCRGCPPLPGPARSFSWRWGRGSW